MNAFYLTNGLIQDLTIRSQKNGPIRLGIVGCGEMGTDLISQVSQMPGMVIAAVADRNPTRILKAAEIAYNASGHSALVNERQTINSLIERNVIAATAYSDDVIQNDQIDVIIDATGVPESGAEIALNAISCGKHIVMMNVEADVTVGAYLNHCAEQSGVLYSLGAGDEPSACMELIQFVTSLGYPIVSAGKGKNNPLDATATPDLCYREAEKRQMNPRMLVEFIDGSKTMVEMAAIANATGLLPDRPGMHGPCASVNNLSQTLIPQIDGGILSRSGVVDYSISPDVAPGVFVVVKIEHPRICMRMEDLKMGTAPYFTFYRPYHLTSLEVPLTCARMMLYQKKDMAPLPLPIAEVCAVAKKDLIPGERLDSIGEYCYRSWTLTALDALKIKAHPCGLLINGLVTRPIKKGELLTEENVSLNKNSLIYKIRKKQNQLFEKTFDA